MLDGFGRGLAVGGLGQRERDKRPAQIVQGCVKMSAFIYTHSAHPCIEEDAV
jgi:hypothetical protein